MKHELPSLNYSFDALEPYIDAKTMRLHYLKHHQAYVTKLNKALENYPEFQKLTLRDLLLSIEKVPSPIRLAIRRNGGGHFNHSLFWRCLVPKHASTSASEKMKAAIDATFGNFKTFQAAFERSASLHFASGWTWLCLDPQGQLVIKSLPNHTWPMSHSLEPLLVLDLWEHAYYLKYQNRRKHYISAFWNIVDWGQVNERYSNALIQLGKTGGVSPIIVKPEQPDDKYEAEELETLAWEGGVVPKSVSTG